MIPKDLQNIIYKYNELGIFTEVRDIWFWFNGKRYEAFKKPPKQTNNTQKVMIENKYYELKFVEDGKFKLMPNIEIPPKFFKACGKCCLVYENVLYFFSAAYNEKYDFVQKKWFKFANSYFVTNVQLLNGIFYMWDEIYMYTYDPKKDNWYRDEMGPEIFPIVQNPRSTNALWSWPFK